MATKKGEPSIRTPIGELEPYPDTDLALDLDIQLPEARRYRELVFDLEANNAFQGGPMATILMASFMETATGHLWTIRIDDFEPREGPWDDKPLIVAIRGVIAETSRLVGWNSRGFDVPLLRTRSIIHDLHHDPVTFRHCDALTTARRGQRWGSAKLGSLAHVFTRMDKPDPPVEVWRRASYGDKKALDIIADRCEFDVRITAEIYLKIEAFITTWHAEVI